MTTTAQDIVYTFGIVPAEADNETIRQCWIDAQANDWPEACEVLRAELASRAPTYADARVSAFLGHVTDSL